MQTLRSRSHQPLKAKALSCGWRDRASSSRWISLAPRIAFCAVFLIALLVTSPHAVADWDVEMDGAGPVKIGMSLAEVNQALGEQVMAPEMGLERSCFHVNSSSQPSLDFMIEEGKLTRIDVTARGAQTDKGIAVGAFVAAVTSAYGKDVQTDKHYLDPNAHYLTALSKDKKFGIRFEIENDKVTAFYAGTTRAINLVEGCE
jgi:hypothetical protein